MYAKLVDGKLEMFVGKHLKYTYEEDGTLYYVHAVNPCEIELNKAGYYKVECDTSLPGAVYVIADNAIVAHEEDTNETALVQ